MRAKHRISNKIKKIYIYISARRNDKIKLTLKPEIKIFFFILFINFRVKKQIKFFHNVKKNFFFDIDQWMLKIFFWW